MNIINALERFVTASLTASIGLTAASSFDVNITVPVFGVPVTVILAAAAGAAASLGFRDPIESRSELFWQTLASTILGASCSVLITYGMQWKWAQEMPGASALVCAAVIRLFLPTLITRAKRFITEFNFSFGRRNGEGD